MMKKSEFIDAVAEKAGFSKKDTQNFYIAAEEIIVNTMKKKEEISLTGLGTFKVSHRNARQMRNPQTGEMETVPAKDVVKFKTGSKLRDLYK